MEQEVKMLLPELVKDLSPIHQGWLSVADLAIKTKKDLENKELVVQGCLLKHEEADLPTLQDKLKQAGTAAAEAEQQRLGFTNLIKDRLVTPMMAYEKRNEALIDKAKLKELGLRLKAEENQKQNGKLAEEEQLFKTHFVNEYFKIAAEYRIELRKIIVSYYLKALDKKIPVHKIDQTKKDVAASIEKVEVGMPSKFERKLITTARATELFQDIPQYNCEEDLKDAQTRIVDETFANYANDFKRPKAAAKEVKAEAEAVKEETLNKLEAEVETNKLVLSGTATVINMDVKVKRQYEAVIGDTNEWALSILSLTIKKWNSVKEHFKVKEISKLTIAQMASALAKLVNETGVQIEGFNVKEVAK